jgi:hypothetical protein
MWGLQQALGRGLLHLTAWRRLLPRFLRKAHLLVQVAAASKCSNRVKQEVGAAAAALLLA